MKYLIFICIFFFKIPNAFSYEKQNRNGYVSVELEGQLGNQLFQIATAYAYALDHDLILTIPNLVDKELYNIPYNAKKLFLSKIDSYKMPFKPTLKWREPSFQYQKIPFSRKTELLGYFQSEKYFKHRRSEILDLFAAPENLIEHILAKYPFLSSDALVVGIQIRDYRGERPNGDYHPTLGRAYYEKAVNQFPKDSIFLVSSNNFSHARECIEGLASNVIYLSGEDYIEEFYTLVLCKGFISSNSSFGWWASWLSTAADKKVIMPGVWFSYPYDNGKMTQDIYPEISMVLDFN